MGFDDPFGGGQQQFGSQKKEKKKKKKSRRSTTTARTDVIKVPGMWHEEKYPVRTKMNFTKFVCIWKFMWKGENHDIVLNHSQISGKRVLTVNGITKVNQKKFFDNGSRYGFRVGSFDLPCVVSIIEDDRELFSYSIEVNNLPWEAAKQLWLTSPDL